MLSKRYLSAYENLLLPLTVVSVLYSIVAVELVRNSI